MPATHRALHRVRSPLLFLSAHNDPIASAGLFDRAAFEGDDEDDAEAPPLLLATTAEGGHAMRWPEGWSGRDSWGNEVLVEWVEALEAERRAEPRTTTLRRSKSPAKR